MSLDHTMTTPPAPWSSAKWTTTLLALTVATLCIHGYHPLAEDGGLYVAGIEYTLDHTLFPHYTAFVQEHLRFSIFAPVIALLVRASHLPLLWTLFLLNLFSVWLMLFAARQILRRITFSDQTQLAGIALLAAWWTLPIAGTSLLLMDPYLTARSFSTPLSLLAIACALDAWPRPWFKCCPFLLAACYLVVATAIHPLMAAYAMSFIIVLRLSKLQRATSRIRAWITLTILALTTAATLQAIASPESAAVRAAVITRYYWFLSQWQWFELLGLLGPLVIFALLLFFRHNHFNTEALTLIRACLVIGLIAIVLALLFARESLPTHLVARLQVLRIYLLIYALMAILLGVTLQQSFDKRGKHIPALFIATMAIVMCFVQRQTFPASPQVELPWRSEQNQNPWVQAFLWAKQNTPHDALFALDAKYVNTYGEDAQTFRATAQRSALPDYSKDGGEASITPALAEQWQQSAAAQKDLSNLTDAIRDTRLRSFGVTWMVLHATAVTTHSCPYVNKTVKVCALTP